MPAKDDFHSSIIHALAKEGWGRIRENYAIRVLSKRVWIDLRAEKEDGSATIFVEIKDFDNPSAVVTLRDAVGQYVLYRAAIKYARLNIPIFLAVPQSAFDEIFSLPIGQIAIEEAEINLVVFDPEQEVIQRWIPYEK